jgi:hypothetical protein
VSWCDADVAVSTVRSEKQGTEVWQGEILCVMAEWHGHVAPGGHEIWWPMGRVGTCRVCSCLAPKREMGPSSHLTVRRSKVMGSACDM